MLRIVVVGSTVVRGFTGTTKAGMEHPIAPQLTDKAMLPNLGLVKSKRVCNSHDNLAHTRVYDQEHAEGGCYSKQAGCCRDAAAALDCGKGTA